MGQNFGRKCPPSGRKSTPPGRGTFSTGGRWFCNKSLGGDTSGPEISRIFGKLPTHVCTSAFQNPSMYQNFTIFGGNDPPMYVHFRFKTNSCTSSIRIHENMWVPPGGAGDPDFPDSLSTPYLLKAESIRGTLGYLNPAIPPKIMSNPMLKNPAFPCWSILNAAIFCGIFVEFWVKNDKSRIPQNL